MELFIRSAANQIMETKLNELVQQLVNGFEEQLEELRKENEMLIRLVWKWETGTAIPCSYCGRTLTDEELADEHNKDDNSKKSCPKCRVLYESNTTAECNSCYETKPCTVEEEDLKDGQEYYYCAECRKDANAAEDEDEEEDSECDDDFDYEDCCDCCVKGRSKANEHGRCVCRCACGKLLRNCRYECKEWAEECRLSALHLTLDT